MKNLLTLIVIAGLFVSCSSTTKNNEAASNMAANDMTAKNEARVKEFYEKVLNAHNPDIVDQYCTADFTDHQPAPGHTGKGLDDLKADFKDWFAMMPDSKFTVQEVCSKGNNVMVKFSMTGTNTGSIPNMPATNKAVSVEGMEMITLNNDGKATDRWGYSEEMKMMTQLGLMPDMSHNNQKMAEEGKMEKMGKMGDQKAAEMNKEAKNAEKMMPKKK